MKIKVNLRERFGRDAEICFADQNIDLGCAEKVREELRRDLQDALTVFGGLIIAIAEDRLANVPNRHHIGEELMSLVERYALLKVREG